MEIFLKTEDEIELLRRANQLVGETLAQLSKIIQPGITTLQLDNLANEFIRDNKAIPILKGFPNLYGEPFPASICTSKNAIVAHGIPRDKDILKDGDIISIDCSLKLDGYCGDSCYTFKVGEVTKEIEQFLSCTKQALYKGIETAIAGNHIGDIGHAIQTFCNSHGYGIVKQLTGHGIGRTLHEEPQIPNYGNEGGGTLLKRNMCLSIEPITTMGIPKVALLPDKWGIIALDMKPTAHFEHTIVVRAGKAEILSTFEEIKQERE